MRGAASDGDRGWTRLVGNSRDVSLRRRGIRNSRGEQRRFGWSRRANSWVLPRGGIVESAPRASPRTRRGASRDRLESQWDARRRRRIIVTLRHRQGNRGLPRAIAHPRPRADSPTSAGREWRDYPRDEEKLQHASIDRRTAFAGLTSSRTQRESERASRSPRSTCTSTTTIVGSTVWGSVVPAIGKGERHPSRSM